MQKVIFDMSMSLDGFVAGPNGEVDRLFAWYFSGDTELPFAGTDFKFMVSKASAQVLKEAVSTTGAIITGRRNFDGANAWDGHPPMGVPHVVVTHRVPQEWVKEGSPFTFVTDGIEHALEEAKKLAGGKKIVISSADVMKQFLKAGLLDEIHIDLVPVLLGEGLRLFDGAGVAGMEVIKVIEGHGVTHLGYRVIKP